MVSRSKLGQKKLINAQHGLSEMRQTLTDDPMHWNTLVVDLQVQAAARVLHEHGIVGYHRVRCLELSMNSLCNLHDCSSWAFR